MVLHRLLPMTMCAHLVGDEMGRIHRIDLNQSSIIAQYNSSRIRDSIHVLDAQQGRYIVASNGIEANTSGLHVLDGSGPLSSVELARECRDGRRPQQLSHRWRCQWFALV
ncbi:MAG: hypothetical protein ACJZ59_07280 [Candidatus Thalassarchaeaceae archaeon]